MTIESRELVEAPEEASVVADAQAEQPERQPTRRAARGRHAKPEPEPEPVEAWETEEASPEEITAALRAGVDVEVASSTTMARQIAQRILESETPEQLWDPIVPAGARDSVEEPLRIFGATALRSSQGNQQGVYVVIDAVSLRTGEKLLITCGATNVVAKLIRAATMGALPENLKFVQFPSRSNPDRLVLDLRVVPAEQLP